jgi:hypothetical protein
LGNIGMVYAEQGKDVLAKNYISQSIKMLEELKDYYAISDYLTYMSDIYLKQMIGLQHSLCTKKSELPKIWVERSNQYSQISNFLSCIKSQ